jgi:hypothetical protein
MTNKKTKAPLQSLSVSMPMTCAGEMASEQVVNVLEKAGHVLNRGWLTEVVEASLTALEEEFFRERACPQLTKLRGLVACGTHVELVAVFYVLLNIDAGLKTRVLQMDPGNKKRIGRFLLDLRQELVVGFFCSNQSVAAFAQACGDTYCIS